MKKGEKTQKSSISHLIWSIVVLALTIGCTDKTIESKATLIIKAPSLSGKTVSIENYNILNYEKETLGKVLLDSLGNSTLQIPLASPTFATLRISDTYQTIYLKRGLKVAAMKNESSSTTAFRFSGEGSIVNNYLADSDAVWAEFYRKYDSNWKLTPKQFSAAIEWTTSRLSDLTKAYATEPKKLLDVKTFEEYCHLKIINLTQQYILINRIESTDGSSSYLRVQEEDIPWDGKLLEQNINVYGQVLDLFLRSSIHSDVITRTNQSHALQGQIPTLTNQAIREKEFSEEILEFLLAKNIDYWLASSGITPSLDSIYNEYQEMFPHSKYLQPLQQKYDQWVSISKGHVAPEITGRTIEGDTVSLTDLVGSKVYVDIWATWCGPCIGQFPYYHELQKELEKANVTFLFVSLDKKSEDWIGFLHDKNSPNGIHINQLETLPHPNVHSSYKIWGIPRYMLIDEKGNIISSMAPRPSSLDKLLSLLNEGA